MKSRKYMIAVAVVLVMFAGVFTQAWAESIYTFEGLTNGQLLGQDNWTKKTTSQLSTNMVISNGTEFDTSKIVSASTQTVAVCDRKNNLNWSFTPFTGTETQAYIQLDAQWRDNTATERYFLLNSTSFNGTVGSIPNADYGPWVGLSSGYFEVRAGQNGTQTSAYITAPTSDPDAHLNDWFRIRLVMDFTTNKMSVFFQNLTNGDAGFTPITPLQNLSANIGSSPSGWDSLAYRCSGTGCRADNLTVGSAIPEPGTLALLAGGLLGLIAYAGRNMSIAQFNKRKL